MAEIRRFVIENYKGIKAATIDVEDGRAESRFITLVGLNESGKTTVLEALSNSSLADGNTSEFMETVQGSSELNDYIPKREKASFTGTISIKSELHLDEDKIEKIRNHISVRHNLVPTTEIPRKLNITREYRFQDSSYSSTWNFWTLQFKVRKRNGYVTYDFSSKASLRPAWVETVNYIQTFLPQIIYFPTFLIDMPNRIYLEGEHGRVDEYYRYVINDVLQGLKKPLSINKHIIDRASKHRGPGKAFSSKLRSSPEGQQIDATVQEISRELNRVIFGAWAEIFGKRLTGKRLVVEWHIDERKGNHVYLELYILDEDQTKFSISERSLGFRWFFSFLLFTQFQTARAERAKVIFLFDEPASHLHARAQQRLLDSFQKIAHPNHLIIYSTHSHYLVNPLWLEKAYIVKNDAVDPDADDPDSEFSDSGTLITVTKYRQFVSENPSKTTYFQPILDTIDYGPPTISTDRPAVIVEGKFDYYPLMFFAEELGRSDNFSFFPGCGAGSLGTLISLFRGWCVPFIVLLDDDEAGRKEKARYLDKCLLEPWEIATVGDAISEATGRSMEAMFAKDTIAMFAVLGMEQKKRYGKHDFNLLFHRLQDQGKKVEGRATRARFKKLFDFLDDRLKTRIA